MFPRHQSVSSTSGVFDLYLINNPLLRSAKPVRGGLLPIVRHQGDVYALRDVPLLTIDIL